MILKRLQKLKRTWRLLAVAVAAIGIVSSTAVPAFAATYSCGAYGNGNYSTGGSNCASSTSGSTVGAPNTGFAKLMEPGNLTAITLSLALVVAGIIIIVRSQRKARSK